MHETGAYTMSMYSKFNSNIPSPVYGFSLKENRIWCFKERSPLYIKTPVPVINCKSETEMPKNPNNTIKTSSKVVVNLKNLKIWLKHYACHVHLYFELKMVVTRSILELQIFLKNENHKKKFSIFVCFFHFCSKLNYF